MIPPSLLTGLLGNKYVWIAVVFVAVFSYYQMSVWSLESSLDKMTIDRDRIALNYNTTKSNLTSCVSTNIANVKAIEDFEDKIKKLKEQNKIIINGQDDEIKQLKKIIADIKKPVSYPEKLHYENITIKIKTKEQIDENDTTFNIISNIGS